MDAESLRRWWIDRPDDVRQVTPPPGACRERVHRSGDPSSPCVLPAGHDWPCEDVEGYTSDP